MATVTGTKVSATVQARAGIKIVEVVSVFAVPVTGDGSAANDIIQMVKVPSGATILDVTMACTDIDTGTPAVALQVGDGGSATRFIGTSTIGQGGGVARLDQFGGLGYKYTADDTIDVKISTVAATKAAGTLTLVARYTLDP